DYGAAEPFGCPWRGDHRVRTRLALVQSTTLLQAVDARARPGPGGGDGRRKTASGEAGHRAGAMPRPRLRHRSPRWRARYHQLVDRGALRASAVDRVSRSTAHWVGNLGEYPRESGGDSRR